MKRTQVYLTKELDQNIKIIAKKENQPIAHIIRDLLNRGLIDKGRQKEETVGEALLKLAGIAGKGPTDLSTNHDKYYEEV